ADALGAGTWGEPRDRASDVAPEVGPGRGRAVLVEVDHEAAGGERALIFDDDGDRRGLACRRLRGRGRDARDHEIDRRGGDPDRVAASDHAQEAVELRIRSEQSELVGGRRKVSGKGEGARSAWRGPGRPGRELVTGTGLRPERVQPKDVLRRGRAEPGPGGRDRPARRDLQRRSAEADRRGTAPAARGGPGAGGGRGRAAAEAAQA